MKITYFQLYKLDWGKVLRANTILWDSSDKKQKKVRLDRAYNTLFKKKLNQSSIPLETDFLFFKSMDRSDYDELFLQIHNTISNKKYYNLEYLKLEKTRLKPWWIIIKYLPLLLLTNLKFGLSKVLFRTMLQARFLELYEAFQNSKFKNLVVFADMQPIDNMLCQISQLKKIKTITLQHGLYIDYKDYFNVNVVNYESSVADYFLAWGVDTQNVIKKYNKNCKVIICGKPLPDRTKPPQENTNYFTVVFDQNIFHEYNKKLLDVAYKISKKLDLKINLRLHPRNNIAWYKLDEERIFFNKDLYESEFVIGHTTSMIYEMMRANIPAYRLNSEIPANDICDSLVFKDENQFFEKFNTNKKNSFDFLKYSKRYVKYISDESLNEYKKFFSTI